MTTTDKDKKEIIRYRLDQAEDTILDVDLLIQHDRLLAAVNRIYYGIFYALLALSTKYSYETSKHAQLIGWFNKNFIHTGIFEETVGQIVNKSFNRRTKSDYDTFVDFEKENIEGMFQEMKEFIDAIKKHLNNK
jgi:uncharacterized protein (UPF0332 family)